MMRLVKVSAPKGSSEQVSKVAFQVGIAEVSVHQEETYKANQPSERKDVIDIATSTAKAKAFIDALLSAPFFDAKDYTVNIRQPRSLVTHESIKEVTYPVIEPTLDIYEELWQFSHITFSFAGRVLIAGLLVAYGMMEDKLLILIAGLLFIPFLPLLLAIAFGTMTKEWHIAAQGAMTFALGIALLFAGGIIIALFIHHPLSYNDSNPLIVSLLISLLIGVAATLALADDVGKREIIALAASAQIAIVPVWLGITLVKGYPSMSSPATADRSLSFLINVSSVIVGSLCTFLLLRVKGKIVRRLISG